MRVGAEIVEVADVGTGWFALGESFIFAEAPECFTGWSIDGRLADILSGLDSEGVFGHANCYKFIIIIKDIDIRG